MDAVPSDLVRGPVRDVRLDGACPAGAGPSLILRSLPLELPYLGEAIQTVLLCASCGYRNTDLLLTRRGEPRRVSLRVSAREHRNARVVRSTSGTIRVPELGASIEPGPRAEAFVSNVEAVLRRFFDVVRGQEAVAEGPGRRRELARVRERIQRMIDGPEAFTLILEDPSGNSDILHPDTARVALSREEAAKLRASEAFIDVGKKLDDRPV